MVGKIMEEYLVLLARFSRLTRSDISCLENSPIPFHRLVPGALRNVSVYFTFYFVISYGYCSCICRDILFSLFILAVPWRIRCARLT